MSHRGNEAARAASAVGALQTFARFRLHGRHLGQFAHPVGQCSLVGGRRGSHGRAPPVAPQKRPGQAGAQVASAALELARAELDNVERVARHALHHGLAARLDLLHKSIDETVGQDALLEGAQASGHSSSSARCYYFWSPPWARSGPELRNLRRAPRKLGASQSANGLCDPAHGRQGCQWRRRSAKWALPLGAGAQLEGVQCLSGKVLGELGAAWGARLVAGSDWLCAPAARWRCVEAFRLQKWRRSRTSACGTGKQVELLAVFFFFFFFFFFFILTLTLTLLFALGEIHLLIGLITLLSVARPGPMAGGHHLQGPLSGLCSMLSRRVLLLLPSLFNHWMRQLFRRSNGICSSNWSRLEQVVLLRLTCSTNEAVCNWVSHAHSWTLAGRVVKRSGLEWRLLCGRNFHTL